MNEDDLQNWYNVAIKWQTMGDNNLTDQDKEIIQQVTADMSQLQAILNSIQPIHDAERVIYVTSICFDSYVDNYSPQWNSELFGNVFSWMMNLIHSLASNFNISNQYISLAIDKFGKSLGTMIINSWTTWNQSQNFFANITQAIPSEAPEGRFVVVKLLSQIITSVKKSNESIKTQFKEVLFSCFDYACTVLNQVIKENMIDLKPTLQLIIDCLRFETWETDELNQANKQGKQDEIISEKLSVPYSFKSTITQPLLYSFLMTLADTPELDNRSKELTFDTIYTLLCVKTSFFASKDEQADVAFTICESLTSFLQNERNIQAINNDIGVFNQLCKLLYKFRWFIADLIQYNADAYQNLLNNVELMTKMKIQNNAIIKEKQPMIYLMYFWIKCMKESNGEVNEMYFYNLLQLVDTTPDVEDVIALENDNIPEAISIIPPLLSYNMPNYAPFILERFTDLSNIFFNTIAEGVEAYEIDLKISFYVNLFVSILKNQFSNKMAKEIAKYEVDFSINMFQFMINSNEVVNKYGNFPPRTLQSLLLFIKYFNRMTPLSRDLMPTFTSFSDFEAQWKLLSERIATMLTFCVDIFRAAAFSTNESSEVIQSTILSLEVLFKYIISTKVSATNGPESVTYNVISAESVLEFMNQYLTNRFEFTLNEKNYKSSRRLASLMTKLVINIPAVMQDFLTYLDQRFNSINDDVGQFIVLVNDLIGIFEVTTKPIFESLFEWIFPARLKILTPFIDQFLSSLESPQQLTTVTSLLKLWYTIIVQKPDDKNSKSQQNRIQSLIKPHSADGIIIFVLIAQALIPTYQAIITMTTDDNSNKYKMKIIKRSFNLMAEILKAEFVMFGAFEFYNDDTFMKLLTYLYNVFQTLDLSTINQDPRVQKSVLAIVQAFCRDIHFQLIYVKFPQFVDMIFQILQSSLCQSNANIISMTIEAGRDLFQNVEINKMSPEIQEMIKRNTNIIRSIINEVWEQLVNNSAHAYSVAIIFRVLLSIFPEVFAMNIQKISAQILEKIPPELNDAYTTLLEELNMIFDQTHTQQELVNFLTKFVKMLKDINLQIKLRD